MPRFKPLKPRLIKLSKPTSIQKRLLTSLLIAIPLLWLVITSIMLQRMGHEIDEINDTQITQVARYLLGMVQIDQDGDSYYASIEKTQSSGQSQTTGQSADPLLSAKIIHLNELDPFNRGAKQDNLGNAKADYMGFAIWDNKGNLLMADDNGQAFAFNPTQHGFVVPKNTFTHPFQWLTPFLTRSAKSKPQWRLFYVQDSRTDNLIAVGQNLKSRQEMIMSAIYVQLLPLLVGLLGFIGMVTWLLRQGFSTLDPIIEQLHHRSLQDATPLTGNIPSEILPLVTALNQRFVKVAETLTREQRFTADASHELRSPLTAIKLNTQLLQQQVLLHPTTDPKSEVQAEMLFEQTQKIADGVERANHLVEQLLTLAKLEPQSVANQDGGEPIDWLSLSDRVLQEVNRTAREKFIQLKLTVTADTSKIILPLRANPVYLQILLRNLLDNAIRYCPEHSVVELILANDSVTVKDNGVGISLENLTRLTERFFRPAGQNQQGSGLGLSIVKRITELYGLSLMFNNRIEPEHGFIVTVFNAKNISSKGIY